MTLLEAIRTRDLGAWFWTNNQVTIWTYKFLIARMRHWGLDKYTFSAINRTLADTMYDLVIMKKVNPLDDLPEYNEVVIVMFEGYYCAAKRIAHGFDLGSVIVETNEIDYWLLQ